MVSKNPQSPWPPFEPIQAHRFLVSAIIWLIQVRWNPNFPYQYHVIISEFWFCQLSLIDQCRLGPCNNSSLLLVERNEPAGTHQAVSSLFACQLDTATDGAEGLRCVVGGQFYLIGEDWDRYWDWDWGNWTLATPCPLFSSSPFSPSTTYCQSGNGTTINCDYLGISCFDLKNISIKQIASFWQWLSNLFTSCANHGSEKKKASHSPNLSLCKLFWP